MYSLLSNSVLKLEQKLSAITQNRKRFCTILSHQKAVEEKLQLVFEMDGLNGSLGEENVNGKTASTVDLSQYKIVKEGEAEVLMHGKNHVFYNEAQVNNRDMSVAVLRTFVSKRKQEHEEEVLARKAKHVPKVFANKSLAEASKEEPADSAIDEEKSNGACEAAKDVSEDGLSNLTKETGEVSVTKRNLEYKPPRVLEALSASGLRALRYAREVEGIGQVVALDNDKASVEACRRNIKFNGSVACEKVESHLTDARVYMLTHPNEFDVVDLDPYGAPSVFLDSAVQSIVDGGLLMCTATDMTILCGNNGEVCYSKYGSYPLRGKYCHEMALRIVLACIESHANRYKRYIVPVLSVRMDFYVRVFVRIYTSAGAMKETPLKLSYLYQCIGCDYYHLQPLGRTVTKTNSKTKKVSVRHLPGFGPAVPQECDHCGKKFNMGGPIWSAPIHDKKWVTSILNDVQSMKDRYPAYTKINAVLTNISEELPDVPLFYEVSSLCATVKCTPPKAVVFNSALLNAGYRVSGSHTCPEALKSDAPMDVIWDILRCWVKQHPIKDQGPDQPGSVILAKEPKLQANFTRAAGALSKSQVKKVVRFPLNPKPNWGPKLRAGRQVTSKHISLLGEEAVNGYLNYEEGDNANAKRQKTEDSANNSS